MTAEKKNKIERKKKEGLGMGTIIKVRTELWPIINNKGRAGGHEEGCVTRFPNH